MNTTYNYINMCLKEFQDFKKINKINYNIKELVTYYSIGKALHELYEKDYSKFQQLTKRIITENNIELNEIQLMIKFYKKHPNILDIELGKSWKIQKKDLQQK